jgi:predicted DNA-binding transcriptional regulator AlpA
MCAMSLDELKPENLLGTSEVAVVLGVSKQRIHALRKNKKFPQPIVTLAATPIWDKREITAFLAEWRPWKVQQ